MRRTQVERVNAERLSDAYDQTRLTIVATYQYTDENGVLLYQNVRLDPKDFRLRRPDGNGGWAWGLNGERRVPYRLPQLLQSSLQDYVFVVEGEKDTGTLHALGFTVTTTGSASSWRPEFAQYFQGRLVCILPDNDDAGQQYATKVASDIAAVAAQVKILNLPGLPEDGGDVSDWVQIHADLDEQQVRAKLMGLIEQAQSYEPSVGASPVEAMSPDYVCMANVEAKPLRWLWQDRFPAAMLSLLVGVEGRGKTFLALDMAARITTGRLWPGAQSPEDAPTVGNVVFLTSEDHLAYTVRPRLDAMHADPAKVFALRGVKSPDGDEAFDVCKHLHALERMLDKIRDVQLVLCDPLTAFLGSTDQHRNGEVRTALARFSGVAERYGCAVIGISHLNKDASKAAIHRTIGSVAFSAAARAVWLVADDKDNDDRRVLCPVKCNLAPMAKSLAFRIQDGAVVWEAGQFDVHADDLLSDDGDDSPIAEAMEFLRSVLGGGRIRAADMPGLAKQNGISPRTLARAKKRLRVKSEREGFGSMGVCYWRLPSDA